jgi:hypothetical protein
MLQGCLRSESKSSLNTAHFDHNCICNSPTYSGFDFLGLSQFAAALCVASVWLFATPMVQSCLRHQNEGLCPSAYCISLLACSRVKSSCLLFSILFDVLACVWMFGCVCACVCGCDICGACSVLVLGMRFRDGMRVYYVHMCDVTGLHVVNFPVLDRTVRRCQFQYSVLMRSSQAALADKYW